MHTQQLLQLPTLSPIQQIAGTMRNEPIERVTMMDAPDIIPYLQRHEFLITTAYHLRGNHAYFIALIEAMARVGGAGIGIKLNRFLTHIPDDVIAVANRTNIPLFILPESKSLSDINYTITEHILQSETTALTEAINVQRELMQLWLEGHDVQQLLIHLEAVLAVQCYMYTPYGTPYTQHRLYDFPLNTNELCSGETAFSVLSTQQCYTLFHIPMPQSRPYILVVAQLEATQQHMMTQARYVIGFALLQQQLLQRQQRTFQNSTLKEALGQQLSPKQWTYYEEKWSLHGPFRLVYGQLQINALTQDVALQLQQLLDEKAAQYDVALTIFTYDNDIVMLCSCDHLADDTTVLQEMLLQLRADIAYYFSLDYHFGISHETANVQQLPRALKEAQQVTTSAQEPVQFYEEETFFALFDLVPNEQLQQYARKTFKSLMHLASDEQQALLDTLEAFLENHCQITDTAKQLNIHRNTVLYRLNKCSTLLGKDLKHADTSMQLRLALRIRKAFQQPSVHIN